MLFGRIICFSLLFFTAHIFAADLSVSPLIINLDANINEEKSFNFTVKSNKKTKIKVEPFDMVQSYTGHIEFVKNNNPVEEDVASWLVLPTTPIPISPDEPLVINAGLKPKTRDSGEYWVAIMVTEDQPVVSSGIQLSVRYAIVLQVDIKGYHPKKRLRGELADVEFSDSDGKAKVSGWFTNLSNSEDWLLSEVQIRNTNRRLVDKFPLKSISATERGDRSSRIFPYAKVQLHGELNSDLDPGVYHVMVKNRFGGRSQKVYRATWIID